jgi:8-oxo-dGTP pyrophosphatase MutT (NUDIX family)
MPHVESIRRALETREPVTTSALSRRNSSVALIVRKREDTIDILYILRALHEADPWSGDIGFPGGRVEPGETVRETAERETREELGIDLGSALYLGRLDDIVGANLPVIVSCFVYAVTGEVDFVPSEEVDRAFWVPLSCLLDSSRHCRAEVQFRGAPSRHPAINILLPHEPVLWGITYRLTVQFLALLGHPLAADPD